MNNASEWYDDNVKTSNRIELAGVLIVCWLLVLQVQFISDIITIDLVTMDSVMLKLGRLVHKIMIQTIAKSPPSTITIEIYDLRS